jgi:molybdopterin-guanine dinucleotide biosynthesis protein B
VKQVVGVIGYQNSGKTTVVRTLARELIGRGHEVAVVKHLSHHLDLPGKDTAVLGEVAGQVGFISPQTSGVFWKKSLSLENLLPYLEADIVLVEGFKRARTLPKIVCLRGKPDDRDLFDGLAICALEPVEGAERLDIPELGEFGVPLLSRDEVVRMADLVEQKAFKLPKLDCGGCGCESCYDLAREIASGTRSVQDCVSLEPDTEILVDGRPLPLNPFIAGLVRGTILGMLSAMKGFRKGRIEIRL